MASLPSGVSTDDDTVLLVAEFTYDLPTAATRTRERVQFPASHTQTHATVKPAYKRDPPRNRVKFRAGLRYHGNGLYLFASLADRVANSYSFGTRTQRVGSIFHVASYAKDEGQGDRTK